LETAVTEGASKTCATSDVNVAGESSVSPPSRRFSGESARLRQSFMLLEDHEGESETPPFISWLPMGAQILLWTIVDSILPTEEGTQSSSYWVGERAQTALRFAVIGAAVSNCLLFPAFLSFDGPIKFVDRPILFTFYFVLDLLLWVDLGCRFITPGVRTTTLP